MSENVNHQIYSEDFKFLGYPNDAMVENFPRLEQGKHYECHFPLSLASPGTYLALARQIVLCNTNAMNKK